MAGHFPFCGAGCCSKRRGCLAANVRAACCCCCCRKWKVRCRWRRRKKGGEAMGTPVRAQDTSTQVASSFGCWTMEPPFRKNGVIRVGLRERLRSWPKTGLWWSHPDGDGQAGAATNTNDEERRLTERGAAAAAAAAAGREAQTTVGNQKSRWLVKCTARIHSEKWLLIHISIRLMNREIKEEEKTTLLGYYSNVKKIGIHKQVFENLRRDRPQVMDKVIPVAGDVTMPSLGISPEDLKLLCDDVSIVFNSAATVRFDEDLRTAVELNVKGPQRLMNVCHQMKRLEVLVASSFSFLFFSFLFFLNRHN